MAQRLHAPQAGDPAMLFQGVPRPTAAGDKQNGESAMILFYGATLTHTPRGLTFRLPFTHAIASVVKGSFGPRHERFRLVAVRPRSYFPPNRQTAVPPPAAPIRPGLPSGSQLVPVVSASLHQKPIPHVSHAVAFSPQVSPPAHLPAPPITTAPWRAGPAADQSATSPNL